MGTLSLLYLFIKNIYLCKGTPSFFARELSSSSSFPSFSCLIQASNKSKTLLRISFFLLLFSLLLYQVDDQLPLRYTLVNYVLLCFSSFLFELLTIHINRLWVAIRDFAFALELFNLLHQLCLFSFESSAFLLNNLHCIPKILASHFN